MGGPEKFNRTLEQNQPDLTNEPGEHYPYLFDYSGQPWKAQSLLRGALKHYSNTPNGIPGNDDCGQLSAWWVFTALGFYPVNPASGVYMIGSPLFDQTKLKLPNGRTFTIKAANNSATNMYVQSATFNGKALNVPFVTYTQIETGGTLRFVMGPLPSNWGGGWSGTPLP
jgi:predicted alpha-1,2-mannosidase